MASQRAGVEVLASASGRVLRTRDGAPDGAFGKSAREGRSRRQMRQWRCDRTSEVLETQYCHMASGSLAVKPGDEVKAGQPLGRVSLSGLTEYPHLHFTVRRKGAVVDPFAYSAAAGSCGRWRTPVAPRTSRATAYQERAISKCRLRERSGDDGVSSRTEARTESAGRRRGSDCCFLFVSSA